MKQPLDELTPQERAYKSRLASLRGSIAAHSKAAKPGYNGTEATRAAKEAYQAQLEAEVDPEGLLSPDERRQRANNLRQARMLSGRLKAAKKRKNGRA